MKKQINWQLNVTVNSSTSRVKTIENMQIRTLSYPLELSLVALVAVHLLHP